MKPTSEVWLEIVKERLAAGDKTVDAIRAANVVTNAYGQRFSFVLANEPETEKPLENMKVSDWEKWAEGEVKKDETSSNIPVTSDIAIDSSAS